MTHRPKRDREVARIPPAPAAANALRAGTINTAAGAGNFDDVRKLFPEVDAKEARLATDAYTRSASSCDKVAVKWRREMEKNFTSAMSSEDEEAKSINSLFFVAAATELHNVLSKTEAPFDQLYAKARNLFQPSSAAVRFMSWKGWEESDAFSTGLIEVTPLEVHERGPFFHGFYGESGSGKTVRLASGALRSGGDPRGLGMYFKVTMVTRDGAVVSETSLKSMSADEQAATMISFVANLVSTAFAAFKETNKLVLESPISGGAKHFLADKWLVLALDEAGGASTFVRRLIAVCDEVSEEIRVRLGFGRTIVLVAGTGVEGPALTLGSDPCLHQLHQMALGSRAEFQRTLSHFCGADSKIAQTLSEDGTWAKYGELTSFVQNRRLLYLFAKDLSWLPDMTPSSMSWCMRCVMVVAAQRYKSLNALRELSLEATLEVYAQVLCRLMLGPSYQTRRGENSRYVKCILRDDVTCETELSVHKVVVGESNGGHLTISHPEGDGITAPRRYFATPSLLIALQLMVGGGLTHVGSGEEFEMHIASYVVCCYMAVSCLDDVLRTVGTFVSLLTTGTKTPLNPPLELVEDGDRAWWVPPEPSCSSKSFARAVLPRKPVQVVVLKRWLRYLSPLDSPEDWHALQAAASSSSATVVLTAAADPTADVFVVIHGVGILPICCKKYEASSALSKNALAKELSKMGAVTAAAPANKLEHYQAALRKLAYACTAEGCKPALEILGWMVACVSLAAIPVKIRSATPVPLSDPAPKKKRKVWYFETGRKFENTYPLCRFTSLERESFAVSVCNAI